MRSAAFEIACTATVAAALVTAITFLYALLVTP
jgi:hypothetical protein